MLDVAIIGGGMSGLSAAKAALEHGLSCAVFEDHRQSGGLWRSTGGAAWPGMRTNLSRHACSFSDFPWPTDADVFPRRRDVARYLEEYAASFKLQSLIQVDTVARSLTQSSRGWSLGVGSSHCSSAFRTVDARFVVVASGFFSRPFWPNNPIPQWHSAKLIHSLAFRPPPAPARGRAVVIGSAFSGCEIATILSECGFEVTHVVRRPMWILKRFVPPQSGGRAVPIDLAFYSRARQHRRASMPEADANRQSASYLEATFGNPGDAHPALRLDSTDGQPVFAVVSDHYLDFVRSGRISIRRQPLPQVDGYVVRFEGGPDCAADLIVCCTGSGPSLPFLSPGILGQLEFAIDDPLQPLILYNGVFRPELPGVAFVGMYRGPYFATIELQARWATAVFAGAVPAPTVHGMQEGLVAERQLRHRRPRPQFPRADYVRYADELAGYAGVLPDLAGGDPLHNQLWDGPLLPAHFRLNGMFANRTLAQSAIDAATAALSP